MMDITKLYDKQQIARKRARVIGILVIVLSLTCCIWGTIALFQMIGGLA